MWWWGGPLLPSSASTGGAAPMGQKIVSFLAGGENRMTVAIEEIPPGPPGRQPALELEGFQPPTREGTPEIGR